MKSYYLIYFLILASCSSAPRYTSSDTKPVPLKKRSNPSILKTKSSFNTHRKTMKGKIFGPGKIRRTRTSTPYLMSSLFRAI